MDCLLLLRRKENEMLTEKDILVRLTDTEHNYVERKTFGNSKGWLKTAVAFANSTPVGSPAVLFIGVKDDGTPEGTPDNLEEIQKTFSKIMSQAYPPIYYDTRVLAKGGNEFLAIVILGSLDRPHFAGHAYIRVGPETKKASEEQFAVLVAERNDKARMILQSKGNSITRELRRAKQSSLASPVESQGEAVVVDCNQFYVTLRVGDVTDSFPLRRVEVSHDNQAKRLKLEIYPLRA